MLAPLVLFILASFCTAYVPLARNPSPSRRRCSSTDEREPGALGTAQIPPTPAEEKFSPRDLEHAFEETMWKMRVLQEYPDFMSTRPPSVREMFDRCEGTVCVEDSTVPAAGRGLFASRDVRAGSVLTFYPVHALGVNFRDGSCFLQSKTGHDHVKSVYVLSLVGNRPIMGIDLDVDFDGMGFVDADPDRDASPSWQCHRINDGAVIEENTPESVMEYYQRSLERQNAAFLPFGPAPIIVAMATKDISKGEEIFTCYGRGYWLGVVERDRNMWSERTDDIALTETKVAEMLNECSNYLEKEFAQEELGLYQAFDDIA